MNRVPLLDLGDFRAGDRAAFARRLDAACRDIGFLVIAGHGVPPALIRRMHDVSAAFFARPDAEKRHLQVVPGRIHGWTGPRQSYLADTLAAGTARAPDWKEGFSIGSPAPPPDPTPQEAPYFAPTQWPAGVPGFAETWSQYYRAMEALAAELMSACAGRWTSRPTILRPASTGTSPACRCSSTRRSPGPPLPASCAPAPTPISAA